MYKKLLYNNVNPLKGIQKYFLIMNNENNNIRLWPLLFIIGLAVIGIGYVWLMEAGHRQDKVVAFTIFILFIAVVLSLIWLVGFSRLKWRVKFISLSVFILFIVALVFLFRFDGFSGDLVPRFEWRWQTTSSPAVGTSFAEEINEGPLTDFPQFLGPNRNAVITSIKLNTDWINHPPELVWKQPIGDGWGSFAVVGNSAITQEQEDEWEKVVCYDLLTGKEKWAHRDKARYYTALGRLGPRATPTIDNEYVYTLGSTGIMNCLNFETGDEIWSTNVFEENNAEKPPWGISCSPLIYDDLVIVSAGGAVAYYKETGDIAWKGHRHQSGYSSPTLLTLAGKKQVVLFDNGLVTSHNPTTGDLLWKQSWPAAECVVQPTPLPGDKLLISSAYGIGSKLFQVSRGNLSEETNVNLLWETIQFKVKFSTIIYHQGYLYGLDDGIFACINSENGKRQWKRGRYGHGQTLFISDVLLVLTEAGELILLEPNPEKHKEIARFQAITGQTWNNPALVGNYLLVRNNREAACFRLTTE